MKIELPQFKPKATATRRYKPDYRAGDGGQSSPMDEEFLHELLKDVFLCCHAAP
jgi:hypothetical protein